MRDEDIATISMLTNKQILAHAARVHRFMPDGKPKYIRLYDNGGESIDRYTVVFSRLNNGYCSYLAMNGAPFYPQGFCQHGEADHVIDRPKYSHLGKKIKWEDLNADCQQAVLQDYRIIWSLNVTAKFVKNYEGCVGKQSRKDEDDPFVDEALPIGERTASILGIEGDNYTLMLANGDRAYRVPDEVLEFERFRE